MSSNQALPTLHATEHEWPSPGPSTHDFAMLEELSFVRREAQAEADEAYGDWLSQSTADAYAVYRAAQDRADAAQDDLARLAPLVG
jgi:hypothetical protein